MADTLHSANISDMDAGDLTARYFDGTLSPVEVTKDVLARIDRFNPAVNAYCHVDAEGALQAARDSEGRWRAGGPAGGLDGVPISIKDLTPVKGMPMRKGSLTTEAATIADDMPFVAHLRGAGAVILGKTTTPEFGWKGVTDCKLTGITRNPWDVSKTPGGSSGGAAAAAALNLGCLHQGSDGGGSIRIPAGFTGTVGFKPSFGWIPQVPSSAMTLLSHLGPIGRSVNDVIRMLDIVARPDGRDWYANAPTRTVWSDGLDDGIAGLRIAFSPNLGYAAVQPEVASLVEDAVRRLSDLGAHVELADPGFDDPIGLFDTFWRTGAAKILSTISEADKARMDPGLVAAAEAGSRFTAVEYLKADMDRAALGARMHVFHQKYDLLVTPTLAVAAFEAGRNVPQADAGSSGNWTNWTPFSYPFNITQQPALSAPCGFTSAGLPVGLQFVAAKFRDNLVLRAARAFLQALPPVFPDAPR